MSEFIFVWLCVFTSRWLYIHIYIHTHNHSRKWSSVIWMYFASKENLFFSTSSFSRLNHTSFQQLNRHFHVHIFYFCTFIISQKSNRKQKSNNNNNKVKFIYFYIFYILLRCSMHEHVYLCSLYLFITYPPLLFTFCHPCKSITAIQTLYLFEILVFDMSLQIILCVKH